jgi:hypothetical protein
MMNYYLGCRCRVCSTGVLIKFDDAVRRCCHSEIGNPISKDNLGLGAEMTTSFLRFIEGISNLGKMWVFWLVKFLTFLC